MTNGSDMVYGMKHLSTVYRPWTNLDRSFQSRITFISWINIAAWRRVLLRILVKTLAFTREDGFGFLFAIGLTVPITPAYSYFFHGYGLNCRQHVWFGFSKTCFDYSFSSAFMMNGLDSVSYLGACLTVFLPWPDLLVQQDTGSSICSQVSFFGRCKKGKLPSCSKMFCPIAKSCTLE